MTSNSASDPRRCARPLQGRCIGISVSSSGADALAERGLNEDAVNVVTVDLARRIIALGGSVVLGHDWRTGGVMEAVSRFALSYAGQSAPPEQPLILNYLGAPDRPSLSASDEAAIKAVVACQTFSWQGREGAMLQSARAEAKRTNFGRRGLAALEGCAQARETFRRGLDLTAMRFHLCQTCDARILLGGKISDYQGLAPGIVEEAWWQTLFSKKLIVSAGMGGAAAALAFMDGPEAQTILETDGKHPAARPFLEDLQHHSNPLLTAVEDLHVDSLLAALVLER